MNARRLTRLFNQSLETDDQQRMKLLKELLGSTGNQIYAEPVFRCDYGYNIHAGENFYANLGCVFIGSNAVIASGAVVTKNMPGNTVVGGIPAAVIKQL
ncbi:hypothetical protein DNH61_01235 [Paenibacillus sambharensis]|uniref:Acetyltransferase n=1 Tax=Paenibacillus sambharensis TaxID=1803190 RepID=A0A2W1LHJ0_9BACL|nr:hypothetical protein DNH61_01235 [Paenibacillus sambharensis]